MMKRIATFVTAIAVLGLSPLAAQDQDYTSYLVNPDFELGVDSASVPSPTGVRITATSYNPKGWTMTWDAVDWDVRNLSSEPGSYWTTDAFGTPFVWPTSGTGFYHHAVSNGGTYLNGTTGTRLPSGKYRLVFDGAFSVRPNAIPPNLTNPQAWVSVDNGAVGKSFNMPADTVDANNATVSWKTDLSLNFAAINDNDSVTIGFHHSHNGSGEFAIYFDNFRIYRTGDVTELDLVDEIRGETMDLQAILSGKFDEIGQLSIPEEWIDQLYILLDPLSDDTTTVKGANAFKNAVIEWTAKLDQLVILREELLMYADSATALLEREYPGVAALATAEGEARTLLGGTPTTDEVGAAVPALIGAIQDYIMSGLGEATYENPVEITFKIVNPEINGTRGLQTADCAPGWTITATGTGQQYLFGGDRRNPDNTTNQGPYFNTWDGARGNAKYTSAQTIAGLPDGVYKVGANLAGDGMGVYVYGLSSGAYTAKEVEVANNDVFAYYEAENIVVVGGTLTIGHTGNADALFGGNASSCTYYSADDFRLFYCGSDISAVANVLNEAIATAKGIITDPENAGFILKGDLTTINDFITSAEAAASSEPLDVEAIAVSLAQVNSISGIVSASVAAYNRLADKIEEGGDVLSDALVSDAAKAALQVVIESATATLGGEYTVTGDIDGAIVDIDDAIKAAKASRIENVTPGNPVDATFLITNPDLEAANNVNPNGTGGWQLTNSGGGVYNPIEAYGFPAGSSRALCAWYGTYTGLSFDSRQVIYNVPSGYYRLTAEGFNTNAGGAAINNPVLPNGNIVLYALGDIHKEKQTAITSRAVAEGDTILIDEGTGFPILDGDGNYQIINWDDQRLYTWTIDSIHVPHDWLIIGVKSIGDVTAGNTRVDNFTLTILEKAATEPYPDGINEVGTGAGFTAYAVDGYIKVEGVANYTVTAITGAVVPADAKLVPGLYIVTAAGKSVKVIVQ